VYEQDSSRERRQSHHQLGRTQLAIACAASAACAGSAEDTRRPSGWQATVPQLLADDRADSQGPLRPMFSNPQATHGDSLSAASNQVLARRAEEETLPDESFTFQEKHVAITSPDADWFGGLRSHGGELDYVLPGFGF
jgi:hypothetical protein